MQLNLILLKYLRTTKQKLKYNIQIKYNIIYLITFNIKLFRNMCYTFSIIT